MEKLITNILLFFGRVCEIGAWLLLYSAVSFVAIIAVTFATPWAIEAFAGIDSATPEAGQFGDQFGYANAIISALAFGGLIVTIQLQRKDLRAQREEYASSKRATEELIELQNQELQSTLEHAETSAFEQMFFRLLELRESIIGNISYEQKPDEQWRSGREVVLNTKTIWGREALADFASSAVYRMLSMNIVSNWEDYTTKDLWNRKDELGGNYDDWYRSYGVDVSLGHYFRLTYNILRMVHEHRGLSPDQRYGYARLMRAQLSDGELWLLYCNCLSSLGWRRMMPLANEYHLFDNLYFHTHEFAIVDRHFTTSRIANHEDYRYDVLTIYDSKTGLAKGQVLPPPGQGFGTPTNDV